ncbi:MAG: sigma 54-interacting transcriptional regulator, partial [Bacillota bacterium]
QVGKATHTFSDILGQSRPIKRAIDVARQAAETDCPVLVTGETGTGKELFAQAIHNSSPRSGNPFIALNCCALTPTLAESELFGHEKGAFTGAAQRRIGLFELAANGTLFLDEVGDLPLELQGKLLRVLQEGEFRRVGGTAVLRSQARIIAATNRDLMSLVGEGLFREDLFFRLNVFHVHVPPLRERRDDIPLLATRFLAHLAARARVDAVPVLSDSAVRVLMQYEWPGNVRELHNVLERAFWATKGAKHIGPNVVLPLLRLCSPGQGHGRYVRRLEDVEKEEIVKALSVFGDTVEGKKAAAQALGIALSTLYAKMKQIGEIGEGTRARVRVRFPEIRSNCARKCRS